MLCAPNAVTNPAAYSGRTRRAGAADVSSAEVVSIACLLSTSVTDGDVSVGPVRGARLWRPDAGRRVEQLFPTVLHHDGRPGQHQQQRGEGGDAGRPGRWG